MKKRQTLVVLAALFAACGGTGERSLNAEARSPAVTAAGPLAISMVAAGPLVQGSFTAYTVSVTNTTASAILSVNVVADFPQATVNQIPAGCVRAPGGQPEIICPLPAIGAGATVTFATQIRPDVAGTLTFTGACGGNGVTVNVVEDVEDVAPAPTDVQVTGSSNNGSPPLGSAFAYTFQVKNDGPFATFGGVSFTDALPAGVSLVGVTTSLGACTAGASIECALGDLAVGAQATIQIAVLAPSVAGTVVDTASVAIGQQADRNPANNTVSVTVSPK